MRWWLWHLIALVELVSRDPSSDDVSDEDWAWYCDFMERHGCRSDR